MAPKRGWRLRLKGGTRNERGVLRGRGGYTGWRKVMSWGEGLVLLYMSHSRPLTSVIFSPLPPSLSIVFSQNNSKAETINDRIWTPGVMARWYSQPILGPQKKNLGSNPVECRWNTCQSSANDLHLAVPTACHVGSAVVVQKKK